MRKIAFRLLIVAASIFGLCWLLGLFLPLRQEDHELVLARFFAKDAIAWDRAGRSEASLAVLNEKPHLHHVFQFATNMMYQGRSVQTVLGMTSHRLKTGDALVVTSAGDVYALRRNGGVEFLYSPDLETRGLPAAH